MSIKTRLTQLEKRNPEPVQFNVRLVDDTDPNYIPDPNAIYIRLDWGEDEPDPAGDAMIQTYQTKKGN